MDRYKDNNKRKYLLYPYFGGDEVAPRDITIKSKILNMGINLHEKLLEIKQDYKNLTNNNSEQINIISNKILDVFEYEYATLLKSENPNYSELKEFIMCFIYGRFKNN